MSFNTTAAYTVSTNRSGGSFGSSRRSRRRPPGFGQPPSARHYAWAALGLFAFTIYGSLLPFGFSFKPFSESLALFEQIALYPTTDLGPRGDWVVSVIQYALLSYLTLGTIGVDRPRWFVLLAGTGVVIACAVFASIVEFLQIYFPPRTVSLNDIIAESIGGIVGVTGWIIVGQRVTGWLRRLGAVYGLAELARRLLPAYLLVLVVVLLMPFDVIVSLEEMTSKYAEGKIRLMPLGGPWDLPYVGKLLLNLASFVPLGILVALANSRRQWQKPNLPWKLLLLPFVIEGLQLFVYSRCCDTTDAVTGCLGIVLGVRVARPLMQLLSQAPRDSLQRSRSLPAGLLWSSYLMGWWLVVAYLNWTPFDFTADPTRFSTDLEDLAQFGIRRMSLAPFVDYYWGSKYAALDNFVRKALAFLPLGVFLAWTEQELYRRLAALRVVILAGLFAIIIEAGRYFLPANAPSTTDVLIFVSGAWLGYSVTRLFRIVAWTERMLIDDSMSN